ncbi:hypothetical protein AMATHDRAFT_138131, partial [Amanita thiersii Skay4041]
FGDLYRGCGCFVKSYYSGDKVDCESSDCRTSDSHTHKAPNCPCGTVRQDHRRIMNLFQFPCDDCKREGWARLTGK